MGGVWEWQSKSAATILKGLLKTQNRSLNVESLGALTAVVELIIHSRSLTVVNQMFNQRGDGDMYSTLLRVLEKLEEGISPESTSETNTEKENGHKIWRLVIYC